MKISWRHNLNRINQKLTKLEDLISEIDINLLELAEDVRNKLEEE